MKIWYLFGLSILLAIPANAAEKEMVTWADFSRVKSVAVSHSYAYFATEGGIVRYDIFNRIWDEPMTSAQGIEAADIQQIWVDQFDQHLYALTNTGYYELNLLFDHWYSATALPELNNPATAVAPATLLFPPPGYTYSQQGGFVNKIGSVFGITNVIDDHSGNLWMGTWGQGAALANSVTDVVEFLPYGLLQNRVNVIWPDGDSVWASGALGFSPRSGISVYNQGDSSFSYLESGLLPEFPPADVNCISGDSAEVYVGTTDGLYRYDKKLQQFSRIVSKGRGLRSENVLSFARSDSVLFLGTNEGLAFVRLFSDSMQVRLNADFLDRIIYDLEVVDSTLWLATDNGAYRLFLQSGRIQRLNDSQRLLTPDVYEIERYGDELWFSAKEGAVRLDLTSGENSSFQMTSTNNIDRVLAVNDEVLAMNTFRGVTLLYYTEKSVRRRDIGRIDGLPSENIFALEFAGDYLWIGSDKGLTRIKW